jgi:hypothetical protein
LSVRSTALHSLLEPANPKHSEPSDDNLRF